MRPEISKVVKLIYPALEDHSSVENRECIRGINQNKNYYFMSHNFPE